jgi:hypothetical protein
MIQPSRQPLARRFLVMKATAAKVSDNNNTSIGRRRFFRIGRAAAASTIAGTAVSVQAAQATAGTMEYGTSMSAGASATMLYSSHPYQTLYLENTAGARALFAASSGDGDAPAVTAQVAGAANPGPALYAENYGTGMGVFAHAFNSSPGVRGISQGSAGVMGDDGGTGTGPGVMAQLFNAANPSSALTAVTAGAGAAVHAEGAHALHAQGAVTLSRSGKATISHPARRVTITVPGTPLTAASVAIATLQTHLDGVRVESAVPAAGTNTVTISVTKPPRNSRRPLSVTVGWFVLG